MIFAERTEDHIDLIAVVPKILMQAEVELVEVLPVVPLDRLSAAAENPVCLLCWACNY